MSVWADLETPLVAKPRFHVEERDNSTATELQRQAAFLRLMRIAAPKVFVFANANAGKRNPRTAKAEGIVAGVADLTVHWLGGMAYIEFKGRAASGAWGKLSPQQIELGNRLYALGVPVGCFFTAEGAAAWLRRLGAPIADVRPGRMEVV